MTLHVSNERPIIFSGEMVRAILDGRKTQTRRVVRITRPEALAALAKTGAPEVVHAPTPDWPHPFTNARWYLPGEDVAWNAHCPCGTLGTKLWVREAFALDFLCNDVSPSEAGQQRFVWWKADGREDARSGRWRPSIHMPRWASRIQLEITRVGVESIQDINEIDAEQEGVTLPTWWDPGKEPTYRHHFAALWDSLNGKRLGCSWADNPWVWVIGFKLLGSDFAGAVA